MKLKIENGVLCCDIPDGEWNGNQEDWERLEMLIVPEGVTEIKDEAFFGHAWICKVVIPGSVTRIGRRAFSYCPNLREVEIGEGVVRVEEEAFAGFQRASIRLPGKSLKFIGDRAFAGAQIAELPTELEHIGEGAFASAGIEKACIPGAVRRIGAEAFRDCATLETVILQDGVEEIGVRAFSGCMNLMEVSFPDSLRRIARDAFEAAVSYTEDGRVYPRFLLSSRDIVIEDEWLRYVADSFDCYNIEVRLCTGWCSVQKRERTRKQRSRFDSAVVYFFMLDKQC